MRARFGQVVRLPMFDVLRERELKKRNKKTVPQTYPVGQQAGMSLNDAVPTVLLAHACECGPCDPVLTEFSKPIHVILTPLIHFAAVGGTWVIKQFAECRVGMLTEELLRLARTKWIVILKVGSGG